MPEVISALHKTFVLSTIRKHFPDARVIAFGSRVRGDSKKYSDLDLAISFPNENNALLSKIAFLEEEFEQSDLPFKVDLVLYDSLSSDFQKIIDRTGVVWI